MSKGGGSQTVTNTPDSATQQYVDFMRRTAMGYVGGGGSTGAMGGLGPSGQGANPQLDALRAKGGIWADLANKIQASGVRALGTPIQSSLPPEISQAQQQYGQYASAGQQGLAALSGNTAAQQQYLNPYQTNLDPYWALARQQAVGSANDQATLEGAFGGGRNDVTQGTALAGIASAQGQQQYQAFLDAMQRAQSAAGMGLGAIGAGAFLPQQYQSGQLGLLQQALGPYGQQQSQQMHHDPFSQLLGLGLTAGGFLLGGPAGAAAGAGASGSLGG